MLPVVSMKATVVSLIESVDLFNYLLKNHHRRVAIISYNLGKSMNLSKEELKHLVLAASLHDIGALDLKDREDLIKIDTKSPTPHEKIGYWILSSFDPFKPIADIVAHHHIHWSDYETMKDYSTIPWTCLILHLADRIDILLNPNENPLKQSPYVKREINKYRGSQFSPELIDKFNALSLTESFWYDIEYESLSTLLNHIFSDSDDLSLDFSRLEALALTFSRIVDFRSHYTAMHSVGVANVAYEIAKELPLSKESCQRIKIAGYLHNIGKIAIPSELLNKKTPLLPEEYQEIQNYTYYTYLILSRIHGFESISHLIKREQTASASSSDSSNSTNHKSSTSSIESDILDFADVFTALCEERPYRNAFSPDEILSILGSLSNKKHAHRIYSIIKKDFVPLNQLRKDVESDFPVLVQK